MKPKKSLPFPRTCGQCRHLSVFRAAVPHRAEVRYDGTVYPVEIDALGVCKCAKCDHVVFDLETDAQIDAAFRKQARLLTADQIRAGRKRCGLKQHELAKIISVGPGTLCTWERRGRVQPRIVDNVLRAFFASAAVRDLFLRLPFDPAIGTAGPEPGKDPAP